ncbi:patatin-like phospholipase domain-containing protein, putative [Eimeria acervulina]|uniref:Patatin-like phospholipase domain-containing protein, putative n=1 Tax=Eimeria acervulina TaxID=5801 RepID=U6GK80_EIMAC|nr:patatin-like phospholipase domain-containing protein, putative [Eimeria acervulina]CDI80631.1 patatin-like phospholipase domain-containing protein, putative [Eimeria acervulina]
MPLLKREDEGRLCWFLLHQAQQQQQPPYFLDGSLSGDVPLKAIHEEVNAPSFALVSQVNPHIFPFSGIRAHGEAGKPVSWRGAGGKWRGGFILSGLEVFLKEHLRFLLRLIALLNVSPTLRGINARALALQPYTGDITVYPRRLHWRHLRLMNDQTLDDVTWYVQEGRLMTFPKLHLISNRIRIEKAIDAVVAAVNAADTQGVAA